MVKNRRLNKPQDVKALLQEQINELRQTEGLDPIQKARVIGYLSSVSLSAYKDGEIAERIDKIMKKLELK